MNPLKHLRSLSLCLLCLCFTACDAQTKKESQAGQNNSDVPAGSPAAGKRPGQEELQKLWAKEKHRLELDYCKLYYNGKQILLYDSTSVLKRTLGENYKELKGQLFYQDISLFVRARRAYKGYKVIADALAAKASYTYIVTGLKIKMSASDKEDAEGLKDRSDSLGFSVPGAKYIKINGMIITNDMMPEEVNALMESNHKPLFSRRRSWAYAKMYSTIGDHFELCSPDKRIRQENWTSIEITYKSEGNAGKPIIMTGITYQYDDNYDEINP